MTEKTHDRGIIEEDIYCKKLEKFCESYVEFWCEDTVPDLVLECLRLRSTKNCGVPSDMTLSDDDTIESVGNFNLNHKFLINSMPFEIGEDINSNETNNFSDITNEIEIKEKKEEEEEEVEVSKNFSNEISSIKSVKERKNTLINSITCEAAERKILKLQKENILNATITQSSQFKSVKERRDSLLNLFSCNTPGNIKTNKNVIKSSLKSNGKLKNFHNDSLVDSLNSDFLDCEELLNDSLVDGDVEKDSVSTDSDIIPSDCEGGIEDSLQSIKSDPCRSLNEKKEFLMCMVSEFMDSNRLKDEECKMSLGKKKYNKYYDNSHNEEKKNNTEQCSKEIPEQLSVNQMISLGSVIPKKSTVIKLEKFFVNEMVWSSQQENVEFIINKTPLGKGTYREAFRATCLNEKQLQMKKNWVVKKLLKRDNHKNALTPDHEARQTVQMHMLAKHFTDLVRKYVTQERKTMRFGALFSYNEIYYGINECGEVVTIEEYVGGNFEKYINNNGEVLGDAEREISLKAVAYMHFSFEKSQRHLLLTDLQGVEYSLVDPEISSLKLRDERQYKLFAAGNLSVFALKKFVETHRCNRFCRMLDLKEISYEEKQEIFNHYLNHLNSLVKCRLNSKFGSYFSPEDS